MRRRTSLLRYLLSREEGWGAIYCVLFAFFGLASGAMEIRDAHRLENDGDRTFANVLALEQVGAGENTDFYVRFAFLHDNVWFENRVGVPEDVYSGLQVEDRLAVRYWREDPNLVEIEAASFSELSPYMFAFAAIFSLIGFGMAYAILVEPTRAYWLLKHGISVQAKVTAVEENEGEGGGYHAAWVGPDGRIGKTSAQPAKNIPPIGSTITILTDPSGKRPSIWEGDL
jgi:hypothetical protein